MSIKLAGLKQQADVFRREMLAVKEQGLTFLKKDLQQYLAQINTVEQSYYKEAEVAVLRAQI